MDEGDGLENRCARKRTVGSNPTPSAKAANPYLSNERWWLYKNACRQGTANLKTVVRASVPWVRIPLPPPKCRYKYDLFQVILKTRATSDGQV